ncbi:MAG: aldo/keto reductase [Clostridiales Family XIII bacterium]|jgi:predicted aldo/keto reductase-like oxidoreductase|nr:aldo/keto reductase [Clostridiales Family XIII bacterium]
MKYRPFPSDGRETSLLGFGTMRLPQNSGRDNDIDQEKSIEMIRYAIDHGVNYVDTAYFYHAGASERVTGKALQDGYREKVLIADKLPPWALKTEDDCMRVFEDQLKKLGVDYIDNYLIHNIFQFNWKKVKSMDLVGFVQKLKQEGLIRNFGFSYHGEVEGLFEEIIDFAPWDFVQIQLNYIDTEFQAGLKGYEYAHSKGIPVVVMEPLKGGKLTQQLPESIEKYWDGLGHSWSRAEWALKWLANLPGILTILSGMNTLDQVKENIRILSEAEADSLTAEELNIIENAAAEYRKLIAYACTGCRYCMPCPQRVDIPKVLEFRNNWDLFAHNPSLKRDFRIFIQNPPSACVECGECEGKCPQSLEIRKAMRESAGIFESKSR